MISVDEISRIREKRTRFKKELYTKIYEQVSRKIRNTVDVGGNAVVVLIPAFVLGFPSFDRYKATSYIIRQLSLGGFNVEILADFLLSISWITRKTGEHKKEVAHDDTDFPTLINLKKAANRYRGNAGNKR
jgi:hypothetical protein|tara:strand:- start:3613 stop:4005 length:393 start_codon:yes stop_codon:yes gene_type:complete